MNNSNMCKRSGLSRRDFVQRAGSGLASVAVLTSLPGPLIRSDSIDKTGIVSLTALGTLPGNRHKGTFLQGSDVSLPGSYRENQSCL